MNSDPRWIEREISLNDFEEKVVTLESLLREAEDASKKLRIEIDLILNSRTYKYGTLLRDKLRPLLPIIFMIFRIRYSVRNLSRKFNTYKTGLPLRIIRFLALAHLWRNGIRRKFVQINKEKTFSELKNFHSHYRGLEDSDQFRSLSIKNESNVEFLHRNIALGLVANLYSKSGKRTLPGNAKHVYIDCRSLEKPEYRERGIGEISRSLIQEVTKNFNQNSIRLIVNSLESSFHHENLQLVSISQLKFLQIKDEGTIYINLSPMTEVSIDVAQFLLNPLVHKVTLFYDLIPSHFPRRYLRGGEQYLYDSKFLCLDFYDEIWCISKSVELELKRHFPKKDIVTRLSRQNLRPRDIINQKNNTIVFIGGNDLRKNNWYAISSILEFCKNENYSLIIIGLHGSREIINFKFSRYSRYFRIEDQISESEKFTLIESSKILVCASLDEGLSLPPIEGILSNTAVVASDISVHQGSLGEGWWLFNPWKIQGLYKSLLQVSLNYETVQVSQKRFFLRSEVKNYFE